MIEKKKEEKEELQLLRIKKEKNVLNIVRTIQVDKKHICTIYRKKDKPGNSSGVLFICMKIYFLFMLDKPCFANYVHNRRRFSPKGFGAIFLTLIDKILKIRSSNLCTSDN